MRILLCGINYAPELTGIGKYTSEMADWLAAEGHEIKVVTAPPYYPAWKVAKGYAAWRYQRETLKGVSVWRCPLWVPCNPSGIKRVLNLGSFALSSLPVLLVQGLLWRPHVVMIIEPPLFCAPAAWLAARLGGGKAWLHIQDFELDAGFDLGIVPASPVMRDLAIGLEQRLMRRFDQISTISKRMLERLALKGIERSRCLLFPNWVDTDVIYPLKGANALRTELHLRPDTIIALYSGNMGEKQGIETLLAVAQHLIPHTNILFLLCGDGAAKKRLMSLAEGLTNVQFLDLQPCDRLNELLNLASIHLLPQRADIADLVMPSKLQGIFASGRPVIAAAPANTQLAQVVEGRGIVVPPGDVTALANALLYLVNFPEEASRLGRAAREFAVANWNQETVLRRMEQAFLNCQFQSRATRLTRRIK